MNDQKENIWKYLPYVTIKDVIHKSRGAFSAWLIITILLLFFGGAFNIGAEAVNAEYFTSFLPEWAWVAILISASFWIYRGEEVKFVVPNFGFKTWLFMCVTVFGVSFAFAKLEWWLTAPIFIALVVMLNVMDNLAVVGKENHEKMSSNAENNC